MKKVELQLFGSFLLRDGGLELGEDMLHSKKLIRLLVYILINRDSVLTHQKLIEAFWEDDTKSPESALKNLMYRLRNAMRVLGDEQYICTMSGAYCWNPEIQVETDYEYFEKLAVNLRERKPGDRDGDKKLCQEIIRRYRGNITGRVAEEPWIISKVTWYRSLYMDTLKKLCKIYEEEENWTELEQVCNQALTIDSLDEDLHYYLMLALAGQKKYDLATFHYEKVKKLFYENLGIRRLDKLNRLFREMMSKTREYTVNMNHILQELQEERNPRGIFFCDYQVFRLIYQMETRRINLLCFEEHVMLLTVRKVREISRNPEADEIVTEGVKKLEEIIRQSFCSADMAARYSPTQFILLLPAYSCEECNAMAEQIQERFQKSTGPRCLELVCEIKPLPEI